MRIEKFKKIYTIVSLMVYLQTFAVGAFANIGSLITTQYPKSRSIVEISSPVLVHGHGEHSNQKPSNQKHKPHFNDAYSYDTSYNHSHDHSHNSHPQNNNSPDTHAQWLTDNTDESEKANKGCHHSSSLNADCDGDCERCGKSCNSTCISFCGSGASLINSGTSGTSSPSGAVKFIAITLSLLSPHSRSLDRPPQH